MEVRASSRNGSLLAKKTGEVVQLGLVNRETGERIGEDEVFRIPKTANEIMDHHQAAAYLKIAPQTLSKWRRTGIIQHYSRISPRKILYYKWALDEFLSERFEIESQID